VQIGTVNFKYDGLYLDRFMDSSTVPLVKCKGKDLTAISNYRAITLSNSITKVLEFVFLDHATGT